jgi:hypothetical protein
MFEMALLRPSKETENKLRWSTHISSDDTDFQIYIPKWRVPEPWPGRILVSIDRFTGSPDDFEDYPTIKSFEEPIEVILKPIMDHTRTVRFAPLGEPKKWPTGEPYIPFSLIPPDSDFLRLHVEWDLESQGQFINVPTFREEWPR